MPWGVAAAVVGSAMTSSATSSAADEQANAMTTAAKGTNLAPFQYNGPGGTSAGLSQYSNASPSNFTSFGALAGLGNGGQGGSSPPPAARTPLPVQKAAPAVAGHPVAPAPTGQQNPYGAASNVGGGGFGITAAQAQGQGAASALAPAASTSGTGIGFNGGYANVNLGPTLNSTFGGLSELGANMTGQAGLTANSGLPQNIANANTTLQNNTATAPGTQMGLAQQYGQNLQTQAQGNALVNAGGNQVYNPLVGYAQGAAANQINAANTGYTANYNSALQQNLAALAIPQAQQSSQLQDQEFQRGQLGTSGGALQTQAQAAGFGQSDLQAAISAQSQAEAQQQTAGSLANSFSGIATGTLGAGTNMMSTGMGQVNNASNVAGNNLNNVYNQNQGINNTDYTRALTNVGTQTSLAGVPTQLASNDLSLGMSALNGASGVNQLGLTDYNAALATSQAQSNAQNKAASNMGSIASQGNFGMSSGSVGGLLTSAGSNISQGNNPFQNITGNNTNYATPSDYNGSTGGIGTGDGTVASTTSDYSLMGGYG